MPAPYNQLQRLRYNYSGREIGIEKYKPFTAANEKASYDVAIHGSLFKSVLESGRFSVSIPSGQQTSAIIDKSNLGILVTGSLVYSPGDVVSGRMVLSGSTTSHPKDEESFTTRINSGIFIDSRYDVSDYNFTLSGSFTGELREVADYSVKASGNFKSQRHDVEEFDFIFITGSYYEGHVISEVPITGEDIAEFDFIFFTGSYQG